MSTLNVGGGWTNAATQGSNITSNTPPAPLQGAMTLIQHLTSQLRGDVTDAPDDLKKMSRDTSIFQITPKLVVYPKDADDLAKLVAVAAQYKKGDQSISLTARSAGTDMTGGPLTSSIVVACDRYLNHMREIGEGYAVVEPGMYYRDFEKETLKYGAIMPSYPASRDLAAIGGIVANNAGGEKTLSYGKTSKYVDEVEVILSNGEKTTFGALTAPQLEEKKKQTNLEGEIYRRMGALLEENKVEISRAKPDVTKNSAGYALWDVVDRVAGTFNLAKLIVGSQGTLAFVTAARFSLVKPKENRAMTVIFLSNLDLLPEIVHRVLKEKPESFESYDNHTLSLAIRFLPQIIGHLGFLRALRLGLSFLPEVWMIIRGGVPSLVLMAEFAETTDQEAYCKAKAAQSALKDLPVSTRIARDEQAAQKYWIMRRESFSLLRKNMKGYYAAPFIDDVIVPPESYPQFVPELQALLKEHNLIYTIAGHIGDGNFHIIPLMDMSRDDVHQEIAALTPKVYALATKYGGSITAEHNDGIIRTPYLSMMFSAKMLALFEETKRIFDPQNLFNPGKKVGGSAEDIKKYMIIKT